MTQGQFAVLTIAIQIFGFAVLYGALVERVKGHAEQIKELKDVAIPELKEVDQQQWDKLSEHRELLDKYGNRLTKVETILEKKHREASA